MNIFIFLRKILHNSKKSSTFAPAFGRCFKAVSRAWGISSSGRAFRSQRRGREFESPMLHYVSHRRHKLLGVLISAKPRTIIACRNFRVSYAPQSVLFGTLFVCGLAVLVVKKKTDKTLLNTFDA